MYEYRCDERLKATAENLNASHTQFLFALAELSNSVSQNISINQVFIIKR
jgi:hypothetical protein